MGTVGHPGVAVSDVSSRPHRSAPVAAGCSEAAREIFPAPAAAQRVGVDLAIASVASAGFAAIFALVRARRSEAFDAAISMRLQAGRNPWLARLMTLVSWPGFPPQSRVIPATITAGLWALGLRLEAVFEVAAWCTALFSTVLKAVMRRPRPLPPAVRVVAADLGGSSFPSGHVITYVGVYGFLLTLVHALVRPALPRRAMAGLLGGLVALIGPSRIYQGHHWATDVAASYLLGLAYLIGLGAVYRRVRRQSRVP